MGTPEQGTRRYDRVYKVSTPGYFVIAGNPIDHDGTLPDYSSRGSNVVLEEGEKFPPLFHDLRRHLMLSRYNRFRYLYL